MGNDLRRLRLAHKLPSQAIVNVIKRRYPGYDKALQSKCEAPEKYGIELRKDGLKDAYMEFSPDEWEQLHKRDGRRCQNRLYCRLDDATYLAFERRRKADGYATKQNCLTALIKTYIQEGDTNETDT